MEVAVGCLSTSCGFGIFLGLIFEFYPSHYNGGINFFMRLYRKAEVNGFRNVRFETIFMRDDHIFSGRGPTFNE